MNSVDAPTQPMAAACPKLPGPTAQEVFLTAGFEAVAGWPLPCGDLPVAASGLGIVQMSPGEWESYRHLCAGERLMREVNP